MHLPGIVAPLCLVAATASYGASTLLLSRDVAPGLNPLRLRSYQAGLLGQGLGFLFSFVARTTLPLLLVQATVAASVAVSAVAGWALGRWRLAAPDLLALVLVVAGISATGAAATPGEAQLTSAWPVTVCLAVALLAVAAGRPQAGWSPPATGVGALAGLAFGGSAVGARALDADPGRAVRDVAGVVAAVLVVLGLLAGQVLLTRAFARSAVAGPVSAMYVVATAWPGLAGVLWLGDLVDGGGWWLAVPGVAVALAGTARLARLESRAAPRGSAVPERIPTGTAVPRGRRPRQ